MSAKPDLNSPDLSGQVALVTGATSGLGLRFAQVLAAAGAAVVLTGRRSDRLKAVQQQIEAWGGRAAGVTMDIRNPADIERAVAEAERVFGTVTILVNNSGSAELGQSISMGAEQFDEMFETNVRGAFLMAGAVARRLIEKRLPGRIVNISSISAYSCPADTQSTLYSMSKSAVLRMTECLAMEWARHHINVNAIAPGIFQTEMMQANLSQSEERLKRLPRGRFGEPHQLDSTLLYLVAPASEFVTGICLRVDDAQTPR